MKLFNIDSFLTQKSAQLPVGDWKAVGIHSSSEVESCFVGSNKLGVKSVLPLTGGGGGQRIDAARITLNGATGGLFSTELAAPFDGVTTPGEKLTLQLYEDCDVLNPPGPRAPYVTKATIASTAMPTTAATAKVVTRVPVSGRMRVAIYASVATADVLLGYRGFRADYSVQKGFWVAENPTIDTVSFVGAAFAFGAALGNNTNNKVIYIDNESFDELVIWCWSPGGGALGLLAEATGERL